MATVVKKKEGLEASIVYVSCMMANWWVLSAELISSMQSHKGIWSSDPGKGQT